MNWEAEQGDTPAPGLIDWLLEAQGHRQPCSLILGTQCSDIPLHRICGAVTAYLNEIEERADHLWRSFEAEDLRRLANNTAWRRLLLCYAKPLRRRLSTGSELASLVRQLTSIGGVVLEEDRSFDPFDSLSHTFHIWLCTDYSGARPASHMCLNPDRLSNRVLVNIIADSFLNWSAAHGAS